MQVHFGRATTLARPSPTRALVAGAFAATLLLAAASPRPARAQTTERVSRSSAGAQANGDSTRPAISASGRHVAFATTATNLWSIPNGAEGTASDVYLVDRTTGACERVSWTGAFSAVFPFGPVVFTGGSSDIALSEAGGVRVAFENASSNNGAFCPDTNGATDIYRGGGGGSALFSLAPGGPCGVLGNGPSTDPAASQDGSALAFASAASNLAPGDTNGFADILVRSTIDGSITRASIGGSFITGIIQANAGSANPAIAADGLTVAFESDATNLAGPDTNSTRDIYVRRGGLAGSTLRASLSSTGAQANGASDSPALSADGRYLAFASLASNLVPGDGNGASDIFLRDLTLGTTTRVSLSSTGVPGNGPSTQPAISGDGEWIAFTSAATNLVPSDTNGATDVFLHHRATGLTFRASVGVGGAQASGPSSSPALDFDGDTIAFQSDAGNLVAGDTNGDTDIFVRTRLPNPANDQCSSAPVLPPGMTAGTTLGAFPDGAGGCASGAESPDVHYLVPASCTGTITFTLTSAEFDPVLSVHAACPATADNELACDDDSGPGNGARLVLSVETGSIVVLRVAGKNGGAGAFLLSAGPCTAEPCSPADIAGIGGFPPPDGELTVDDYTAFINAFAADDLLADIVAIGGFPPPDAALTVDDYTSFINLFAEGC